MTAALGLASHLGTNLADRIGRAALCALYVELALFPKPGLVSPFDSGAHDDMDVKTFFRSLRALRFYFRDIAAAGADGARFDDLRRLGQDAEIQMLTATAGINTHRGAIFNLGLLAAAFGALSSRGAIICGNAPGRFVAENWGEEILAAGKGAPESHGSAVTRRYGIGGARHEAAAGFPLLFEHILPAFRRDLLVIADSECRLVQTLFRLMAGLNDTNILHRGGRRGLAFVQSSAKNFLTHGGVRQKDWRLYALNLHKHFIERRLSPGGAADMLAAVVFVHDLQTQPLQGR